ncbi:hypothetical protein F7725_014272 [Dissostichus mawsoni]|uniref:Uncharacterized protein n=1 Tax=Dissostichus mawsoni TaxID=36200 RepID=A0A7J5YVF6_DISMA|nr:hypothetical protein F7725_014272 [Dissostichus mawsoni]
MQLSQICFWKDVWSKWSGTDPGVTLGPQPLKATIPYQLSCKPRSHRRDGKTAGKPKSHQLSSGMRRTMSLDAIIGPYLQGHWPKEPEGPSSPSRKDKSTQTPDAWSDKSQSRRSSSSSHKRSASWGSAEHLREIAKLKQQLQQRSKPAVSRGHDKDRQCGYPRGSCSLGTTQHSWSAQFCGASVHRAEAVSHQTDSAHPHPPGPPVYSGPPLRCSVEGLNQELEGMFICQPAHPQHRLLEVPDGHRAPVPPQSCSSGSQSDPATTPLSSSSSTSPHPVPLPQTSPIPHRTLKMHLWSDRRSRYVPPVSVFLPERGRPLVFPGAQQELLLPEGAARGLREAPILLSCSSPRQPMPALLSSCPDPNKVNFTPYGGSAFCPVSLLRPLLPSMDMLFRGLAVSPAGFCSSQGTGQAPPDPPSASPAVVGESSGEGLAF